MSDLEIEQVTIIHPPADLSAPCRIEEGNLLIRGDRLVKVGENGQRPNDWQPDERIDGRHQAALPGFINLHMHAGMSLFRGYADDLALMPWLEDKIWPVESLLQPEDVYWGTALTAAELIRSGITTFVDQYFFMEQTAQAVRDLGLRAVLARGLTEGGDPDALEQGTAFFHNWHGQANGRIEVMLGPHSPYTCPPAYIEDVLERAQDLGAGIHIHLAETAGEVDECRQTYGKTPIQLMNDLGLFEQQTIAAHCVHLTEDDIECLAEHPAVGLAHNPVSNQKLASGIAPVTGLLTAGARVGLGTDGAASTNTLDMFSEMRAAAWGQKLNNSDPTALPAAALLSLATRHGARALGRDDLGLLAPGKKADLLLVDLDRPHLTPQHDLVSLLVYSAHPGDVTTTVVDGRILMRDRQIRTGNLHEICEEAGSRAKRLASAAAAL